MQPACRGSLLLFQFSQLYLAFFPLRESLRYRCSTAHEWLASAMFADVLEFPTLFFFLPLLLPLFSVSWLYCSRCLHTYNCILRHAHTGNYQAKQVVNCVYYCYGIVIRNYPHSWAFSPFSFFFPFTSLREISECSASVLHVRCEKEHTITCAVPRRTSPIIGSSSLHGLIGLPGPHTPQSRQVIVPHVAFRRTRHV